MQLILKNRDLRRVNKLDILIERFININNFGLVEYLALKEIFYKPYLEKDIGKDKNKDMGKNKQTNVKNNKTKVYKSPYGLFFSWAYLIQELDIEKSILLCLFAYYREHIENQSSKNKFDYLRQDIVGYYNDSNLKLRDIFVRIYSNLLNNNDNLYNLYLMNRDYKTLGNDTRVFISQFLIYPEVSSALYTNNIVSYLDFLSSYWKLNNFSKALLTKIYTEYTLQS